FKSECGKSAAPDLDLSVGPRVLLLHAVHVVQPLISLDVNVFMSKNGGSVYQSCVLLLKPDRQSVQNFCKLQKCGYHLLDGPVSFQRKLEQCGTVGSGAMLHWCPVLQGRRGAEEQEREADSARSWCCVPQTLDLNLERTVCDFDDPNGPFDEYSFTMSQNLAAFGKRFSDQEIVFYLERKLCWLNLSNPTYDDGSILALLFEFDI
ncbi:hypothetical protein STEG23_020913, partial [Scotinomys teguina]